MFNIRTFISIILTLTCLLTIYIKQIPPNMEKRMYDTNLMKKIVAYSLEKRLEMESETVDCERQGLSDALKDNEIVKENNVWRRLDGTGYYLYSIYEDTRLTPYKFVRVLGMAQGKWNATLYCNAISTEGDLHVTRATRTVIWSDNWVDTNTDINYTPIMFSCRIPQNGQVKIYLDRRPCKYDTTIYTSSRKPKKNKRNGIAVCVKALDFREDISRRLVEWIEINKILGAASFHFYIKFVHPNVRKVLEWYRNKRFKLIEHADLDKKVHGLVKRDVWQKRKNEILTYNDCFYKNLQSDYVLPIDIDEIIVPKKGRHWSELIARFPENYASYSIRNAYYLHPHLDRTAFFSEFNRTVYSDVGESGKSFVSTRNALTVFNHYALHGLRPGISRCYFVPEDFAQMNHYRETCPADLLPQCEKYLSSPKIFDDIILQYKEMFEFNFQSIWKQLQFI